MSAKSEPLSIAVAMATFNGERFLPEQLASLAEQTRLPAEMVVVDDGSTDATVAILEGFASAVPFPVRLLVNEGSGGPGSAFVRALGACTADLVAFCDQDDLWHPDKLARCAAAFDARPGTSLVVHAGRVVDEALQPTPVCVPKIARTEAVAGDRLSLWFVHRGFAIVIPRWLGDVADGERRPRALRREGDRPMDHDEWACLVAPVVGTITLLADELASYRRHGGNYSIMDAPGRPVPGPLRRVRRNAAALTVLRPALGGNRGVAGLFDADVKATGYRTLASQCREAADYLRTVRVPGDAPERRARRYERAARILDARAAAVDPVVGRGRRVARVVGVALRGGYGRRWRGGIGLTSLPLDVAVALAGRPAPAARE